MYQIDIVKIDTASTGEKSLTVVVDHDFKRWYRDEHGLKRWSKNHFTKTLIESLAAFQEFQKIEKVDVIVLMPEKL